VAQRFAYRMRQWRTRGGKELRVSGDQLHEISEAVKLDDVRAKHGAPKRIAVANAVRAIGLQKERLVELLRLDLQPDLFVLAVESEESRYLLGVLHHVGKWLSLTCDRRGGRCGEHGETLQ